MFQKLENLYKNNKIFRTFLQSFLGYIVANTAYVMQQIFTDGKDWYKVLLCTLLAPAVATALAAAMNRCADTAQSDTQDDDSALG